MPNRGRRTPPLPLWRILLAELRLLRPDCAALGGAAIERLARSDAADGGNAEKLPELFGIAHSWTAPGAPAPASAAAQPAPAPLAALCFSGGGIRSATFNLGVLQGLARLGLLRRFDYLSSVSGGG